MYIIKGRPNCGICATYFVRSRHCAQHATLYTRNSVGVNKVNPDVLSKEAQCERIDSTFRSLSSSIKYVKLGKCPKDEFVTLCNH